MPIPFRSFASPRLVLYLLALAAQLGPASATAAAVTLEEYLQRLQFEAVPLQLTEVYQPHVQADLGDGKRRTFLVDTGCRLSILREGVAHKLKTLDEMGVVREDSLRGPITNAPQAVLEKLILGPAQFVNQPVQVKKLDIEYITMPYDGILGIDFLRRNRCLIDCYKKRLYVRGSQPTAEESAVLAETLRLSGFAEIPMRFRGLLSIAAQVNGEPIRLWVDTGAAFSMLDEAAATRLGLTAIKGSAPPTGSLIPEDLTTSFIGVNRGGKHKVRVTTLNTLEVGPRKWEKCRFGLARLDDWGIDRPGRAAADIAGFLGPDYLTGKGALIDFANRTLWLRPEGPPASAKASKR